MNTNSYLYPVGRPEMTIERTVSVEKDVSSLREDVNKLVDRMEKTTNQLNDTNLSIAELIGELKVTNSGILEQKKKVNDQEERLRAIEKIVAEGKTGRDLSDHVIKTVIAATVIAVGSAVINVLYSVT